MRTYNLVCPVCHKAVTVSVSSKDDSDVWIRTECIHDEAKAEAEKILGSK